MGLRREQRYLVTAVQTQAVHNYGSQPDYLASQFRASVIANRYRRDASRTGYFTARRVGLGNAPDSLTPSGFGPLAPVVVGASISFRGPRISRTRSRLLSEAQRNQVIYQLRPPQVVTAALSQGIAGSLAPVLDGTSIRRRADWALRPPQVVTPATVALSPALLDGYLTPPRATNPPVRSRLAPPATLTAAAALNFGPHVEITRTPRTKATSRLSDPAVVFTEYFLGPVQHLIAPRSTRPRFFSRLRPPTDTVGLEDQGRLQTHLAYSKRGAPKSDLRPPVVIDDSPQVAYLRVKLTRSRPGLPKSRLSEPILATSTAVFFGPSTHLARGRAGRTRSLLLPVPAAFQPVGFLQVTLAPSRRGAPRSRLSLTAIVDLTPQVYYISTTLTRGRAGVPKSRLAPPAVVTVTQVFTGPAVHVTRGRAGLPKSVLHPPVVVFLAVEIYGPETQLAYSLRGKAKSRLFQPTDLVDQQDVGQVKTHLAYSRRGTPKSRLAPPVVVFLAVEIYGPKLTLARINPPPTMARLSPPQDTVGLEDQGRVVTHLAYSRRGAPKSRLLFSSIVVDLTPQVYYIATALVRIRPPHTIARLGRPTDLVDDQDRGAVQVTLAYSLRGRPKSTLRPPTVIDLTPQVYYLATWLVRNKPQPIHSALRRPTDLVDDQDRGEVRVTLARIKHPPVQSILRKPTDLVDQQDVGTLVTTLAYSLRGKAKSFLRPPADTIGLEDQGRVRVQLARIRPVRTIARVKPPTVIDLRPQTYYLAVTLAPSRRGTPKSKLSPASGYGAQFKAETTLVVTLAYSVRGKPKSVLHGPVVVTGATVYRGVSVWLARQTRPVAKSRLSAPAVVAPFVAAVYTGPAVHLAKTFHGAPKSRLLPVPAAFQPVGTTQITLAYQSRRPGKAALRPPVDTVGLEDQGHLKVTFARIRPVRTSAELRPPTVIDNSPQVFYLGVTLAPAPRQARAPHSKLRPPTVIDLRPQTYYLAITLAPSFRGRPTYFLAPPTDLVDRDDLGRLKVTLAPSSRLARATHSRLRPPTVIDLRPQVYSVTTWLTYSLRGKPKPHLSPASPFASTPKAETVLQVTLAYSLRGRPKSRLRGPIVIDLRPQTKYLRVWLTRNKVRPTRYRLRPPTVTSTPNAEQTIATTFARITPPRVNAFFTGVVYAAAIARPLKLTLTRIRPPRTVAFFTGAVYEPPTQRPVATRLAYSLRGRPKSRLAPPAVVTPRATGTISVTLAPSSRGKATSFLSPPAAINDSPQVAYVKTHLVRIRPVKTTYRLYPPNLEIQVCYGTVVGFDFAPEVCGYDTGAIASGEVTAAVVTGTTTGAQAQGATAPGGSVTGGDEKREGC